MRRREVVLDCDGVLADFVSPVLDLIERFSGKRFTAEQITSFDIWAALDVKECETACWDAIKQPGFCASLRPYPGAIDAIRSLRDVADVYVATSPVWSASWVPERAAWLVDTLGIQRDHVLHGSPKHIIAADVFVDDKLETVIRWAQAQRGQAVIWDRPWNQQGPRWAGTLRTSRWDEILSMVM